ncbi:hypothetical protein [Methylobacterium soli]|uniref:Uncharacterized protein n=1 Tax=Methylobacterium soli TaxID=553447 RepID=A0A6L3T2E5_9HYPH|nr:hypothetical protein [Methylobacterium soli]KAB1080900.1 hypothetical protein F6X53_04225 [Methylobacterium soli]
MPMKAAWVMSDSDTFELLNAIDDRLTSARPNHQQRDTLVRLRSLLEDDFNSTSGGLLSADPGNGSA